MKVILSADPIKFPLTGIGRYTYELGKALSLKKEIDHLCFFSSIKGFVEFSEEVESVASDKYLSRMKALVQSSKVGIALYQLVLPMITSARLSKYSDYIFHGTNFFTPKFNGVKITTFHDLTPFKWESCNTPERISFLKKELLHTIKSADYLVTDSEYVRQEIMDYFSYPSEKIITIPLAAADVFHPRPQQELNAILIKYGLKYKRFTFFAGTIEPRKNILTLLNAYQKMPISQRQEKPLILAGYKGWCSESIHQAMSKGQSEGWIKYLGFVPAEELPLLYSAASVFVFPSLYEGFGLPVLEAMQSGVPVVCSNSSSLPEVSGGVALMSDPEDVDALYMNIEKALNDQEWRDKAIVQGIEHSKQYSWTRCAVETIELYRRAQR